MDPLWLGITSHTELCVAERSQPHVILTVPITTVTIMDCENDLRFMCSYLHFTAH